MEQHEQPVKTVYLVKEDCNISRQDDKGVWVKYRAGKEIQLTPQEYEDLKDQLESPQRVAEIKAERARALQEQKDAAARAAKGPEHIPAVGSGTVKLQTGEPKPE